MPADLESRVRDLESRLRKLESRLLEVTSGAKSKEISSAKRGVRVYLEGNDGTVGEVTFDGSTGVTAKRVK